MPELNSKIALIGAISENGIYGKGRNQEGKIPWTVQLDMSFFAKTTTGDGNNTVAMTRGMWAALPEAYRPLKNRRNIVVTKDVSFTENPPEGVIVARDALEAIQLSRRNGDIFFCGGPKFWEASRSFVDTLYINIIHQKVEGNDLVPFPLLLEPTKYWPEFEHIETSYKMCPKSGVRVGFCEYRRK